MMALFLGNCASKGNSSTFYEIARFHFHILNVPRVTSNLNEGTREERKETTKQRSSEATQQRINESTMRRTTQCFILLLLVKAHSQRELQNLH